MYVRTYVHDVFVHVSLTEFIRQLFLFCEYFICEVCGCLSLYPICTLMFGVHLASQTKLSLMAAVSQKFYTIMESIAHSCHSVLSLCVYRV